LELTSLFRYRKRDNHFFCLSQPRDMWVLWIGVVWVWGVQRWNLAGIIKWQTSGFHRNWLVTIRSFGAYLLLLSIRWYPNHWVNQVYLPLHSNDESSTLLLIYKGLFAWECCRVWKKLVPCVGFVRLKCINQHPIGRLRITLIC